MEEERSRSQHGEPRYVAVGGRAAGMETASAVAALVLATLAGGSLGGRVPTPYQGAAQGVWLSPQELLVPADYPPDPCCYPEPSYTLRRRWDDYYWQNGDQWYHNPRPTRVRLGHGRFTLLSPLDAVLVCEFPDSEDIISNVVWVRADLSPLDVRAVYGQRDRDCRPSVATRPRGSSLYLPRVGPLDVGLYRCLATSRRPGGLVQTVFQDVDFFPSLWTARPGPH